MRKKIVAYAFLPVLALGFAGVSVASAQGFFGSGLSADEMATRHQTMFQEQATLLGISVEDVKSGWAEGKSIQEIALAKGITLEQFQQKMKDARIAQMKTHMQAMVTKGIITQAQADQRIQFMQTVQTKGKGGMMGNGMHGGFGGRGGF
jgi:hypothetical protein